MKLFLRYSLVVAAILGSAAGCTANLSSTEVDIPCDALVKAGSALQLTAIQQKKSHCYYHKRLLEQYRELMDQVDAVQAWAEALAGLDVVARCAAGEVNEVETIVGDVEEGTAAVEVEITVAKTVNVEHEKKFPCCGPKEDRKEDSTDEDICNRDLKTEDAKVIDKDSKDKDGDEEINKAEADHVHSTSDESDAKESTSESDEPHKKSEGQCEPSDEKNAADEECCGKEAPKDNEETREDEGNHTDKVHGKSDGKEDKGDGEVKETKTDDDATKKNSTEEPAGENDSTEEKAKNDKETVAEKEEHEKKSDKTKKKEKKEKKNGKSRQSDDAEDETANKGDCEADIANEEDASKKPTEDASKKPTKDAEKEKVAPVIESETGESALEQELEAENLDKVVADQDSMASFNKPTAMTMIVGILSLGSVAVLY